MNVNDIVGEYHILGNNQDKDATEYGGTLKLSLDYHLKIIAKWNIGNNQEQFGTGFFKDNILVINFSYKGDNDEIYDDNIKTNYDGTFKFNNLRKGSYKVFAYNEDKSSVSTPLTPVFISIDIGGNEEGNVGTITIEKK